VAPTLQPGAVLYVRHYSLVQKKSSASCLPSHLWSCVRDDGCRTSVCAAPWTTRGSSLRTARWTLRTPTAQHTCLMGSNRVHNSSNKWHRILKIQILLGCDAVSTSASFRCLESLAKPLPTLGFVFVPIRSICITEIVLKLLCWIAYPEYFTYFMQNFYASVWCVVTSLVGVHNRRRKGWSITNVTQ